MVQTKVEISKVTYDRLKQKALIADTFLELYSCSNCAGVMRVHYKCLNCDHDNNALPSGRFEDVEQ